MDFCLGFIVDFVASFMCSSSAVLFLLAHQDAGKSGVVVVRRCSSAISMEMNLVSHTNIYMYFSHTNTEI